MQASALPMKVGPCISTPDSEAEMPRATSSVHSDGGQGEVAAGEGLADAHDVGHDAGGLGGEQRAGAAEAGRDLVEDQQQPVLVGDLAHHPQARGVVDPHAAGALQQRLDDDPGELVRRAPRPARGTPSAHAVDVAAGGRRPGGEDLLGQHLANIECIPPTGSHTLMQPNVSPW